MADAASVEGAAELVAVRRVGPMEAVVFGADDVIASLGRPRQALAPT
jgi:hypothetical protein